MTHAQKRTASESVIDDEAYGYMNKLAHVQPGSDPFTNDGTFEESTETSYSCSKTPVDVSEAAPEPDNVENGEQTKDSSASQEYYCEKKIENLKKWHKLLLSATTVLTLMFVATLIGLIMAVVSPRQNKDGQKMLANSYNNDDIYTNSIGQGVSEPHHFPHFNGKDPEIAMAFADHSLYTSFYGVTYAGPSNSSQHRPLSSEDDEANENLQHQVTSDISLLSRVTPRIRISKHDNLSTDRVIQAISDLNINLELILVLNAEKWPTEGEYISRIFNSYDQHYISTIVIEKSVFVSVKDMMVVYETISGFLSSKNLSNDIKLIIATAQQDQANPLKISSNHPQLAAEWINNDHGSSIYTNLETPIETSEKAQYMTAWVCGVAPYIRSDVKWFWPNAFDSTEQQVFNGIFDENRELKPAGLPRCQDYQL